MREKLNDRQSSKITGTEDPECEKKFCLFKDGTEAENLDQNLLTFSKIETMNAIEKPEIVEVSLCSHIREKESKQSNTRSSHEQ